VTLLSRDSAGGAEAPQTPVVLGRLATGGEVALIRSAAGWGLTASGAGDASASQAQPLRVELFTAPPDREAADGMVDGEAADGIVETHAAAYESVAVTADGKAWLCRASVAVPDATVSCEDTWRLEANLLSLDRTVTVTRSESMAGRAGDASPAQGAHAAWPSRGFLTAIVLDAGAATAWDEVQPFAPGMIYGRSDQITGVAIGGLENFAAGVTQVRIRQDRLPAPLFGLHFKDRSSLAVMDTKPDGSTTAADAEDVEGTGPAVDTGYRFAALGAAATGGAMSLGMWFPGTEGEVTYRGETYPHGQVRRWRRRYHPLEHGLVQQYSASFRFGRDETFTTFRTAAWRWAWQTMRPEPLPVDVDAARRSLVDILASQIVPVAEPLPGKEGLVGIPFTLDATTGRLPLSPQRSVERAPRALMGWCGRNTEAAYFLLRESDRQGGEGGAHYRALALALAESFVRLRMDPPESEGFELRDGSPAVYEPHAERRRVHLRPLAEGGKSILRSWRYEQEQGRDHPRWRQWAVGLGDWLLSQEAPGGGFPRSWEIGTGLVTEQSLKSSYNAIAFLVSLSSVTGDGRYLDAAVRTGVFSWADGQQDGSFVGGTLDNQNVTDKEAGTMALEAYLRIYEATQDSRWLERARAAGDFAETWIFTWNVPMPDGIADAELHWKRGLPTAGLQLIATGHSLVDAYMAFDVAEYARLATYTEDPHYLDVARLLLHNTKAMMALPGRTYDLPGPGWQQEHWSLAPRRGRGIHRRWLPWIACSHLEGIVALEDFDLGLFSELAAGGAPEVG